MGPKQTGLIASDAKHRVIPSPRLAMRPQDKDLPKIDFGDQKPEIEPPFDQLPAATQKLHLWALARPEMYATSMSEREWSAETMAKWRDKPQEGTLGKLPLIVLAKKEGRFGNDLDTPAEQLEKQRKEAQVELSKLSSRGKMTWVPSGHNMQIEAPDAVVKAILELVDQARGAGQ